MSKTYIEPRITIGIMDLQRETYGILKGEFYVDGFGVLSGRFTAKVISGMIVLSDEYGKEIRHTSSIRLSGKDTDTFLLFGVTIGSSFHWERKEAHEFRGALVFKLRPDHTMAVINDIGLEAYLESVISSEMSAEAPAEFLKAHAIISRSWLLSALKRKKMGKATQQTHENLQNNPDEVVRWYEQEEHDIYDVCADDHCQRYQGITRIISEGAHGAVKSTSGIVLVYQGEICDARYYKACGGITEDFATAWHDIHIPYLTSISDGPDRYRTIRTEKDATDWICSEPNAYCNVKDKALLKTILPDFDRETKGFFRWKIEYTREALERTIKNKTGIDFGVLHAITPLLRGPSGRIYRLLIKGSKKSMIVGKELEIRRWLSDSHLYSSAFVVDTTYDASGGIKAFTFFGAGWGHGVGLCQIGAANMAYQGFEATQILKHYFPGAETQRIY